VTAALLGAVEPLGLVAAHMQWQQCRGVQDGVLFEDMDTGIKQQFEHVGVVDMPVGVGYLDAEHNFVLEVDW
jgi:hypothetical protein